MKESIPNYTFFNIDYHTYDNIHSTVVHNIELKTSKFIYDISDYVYCTPSVFDIYIVAIAKAYRFFVLKLTL